MIGLRQATCQDAVALAALHRLSRAQSMPWLPVLHSQAQNISYFQNRVLGVNTVWTVHQNERLAGFIAYGGGWVNHLYIHPDHWRHGHGQRLLRQAQAEHQPLLLWVFQRNTKAQAF